MIKKKSIFVTIIIALVLLACFYFDKEIVDIISLLRNSILDSFFLGITFLSSKIILFSFLTILFLFNKKKVRWVIPLWMTFVASVIISFILKISIQRPRPFQFGLIELLPSLGEAAYSIWNFSLPSFHAMLTFAVLPLISKEFPKLKYAWIVFAVLVSFSRLYFGLHFLSDLIIGGAIGYILGMLIIKTEEDHKFGKKIYEKITRK